MICSLCKLETDEVYITNHHLIPKSYHTNKKTNKLFSVKEMNETVALCTACHNKIHSCIKEKDLVYKYNTINSLLSVPEIQTWYEWKRKHPNFNDGISKKSNNAKN